MLGSFRNGLLTRHISNKLAMEMDENETEILNHEMQSLLLPRASNGTLFGTFQMKL